MAEIPSHLFRNPTVRLHGPLHEGSLDLLLNLLGQNPPIDPFGFELTTNGGDADVARRMALEMRLYQDRGHTCYFFGKTVVYSAGITIMAAFPIEYRFLTEDAVLLVHGRRMQKSLQLDGPMEALIQIVKELLSEIEMARKLEQDGFRQLVEGSNIGFEELSDRARSNFYITAQEALKLGLIGGII